MGSDHWANQEQQDYMNELARIPLKELAWCGWYRKGECATFHGDKCADPELSCANKCRECNGRGAYFVNKFPRTCDLCNGTGRVTPPEEPSRT